MSKPSAVTFSSNFQAKNHSIDYPANNRQNARAVNLFVFARAWLIGNLAQGGGSFDAYVFPSSTKATTRCLNSILCGLPILNFLQLDLTEVNQILHDLGILNRNDSNTLNVCNFKPAVKRHTVLRKCHESFRIKMEEPISKAIALLYEAAH